MTNKHVQAVVEEFEKKFGRKVHYRNGSHITEVHEDCYILESWLSTKAEEMYNKGREDMLEDVLRVIGKDQEPEPGGYYFDNTVIRNRLRRHLRKRLSGLCKIGNINLMCVRCLMRCCLNLKYQTLSLGLKAIYGSS